MNYTYLPTFRSNTTTNWTDTDLEENYITPNIYKSDDIQYKFNSHGFRCEDFDKPTDISIVFLGCSTTMGVGLPEKEIWASKLINHIRQITGKSIPYWNLAIGGTGLDTQTKILYWFSKTHKIDYVFGLLPPIYRREYMFQSRDIKHWIPESPESDVSHLFIDECFALYQQHKNLQFLDSILSNNKGKMLYTEWARRPISDLSMFNDLDNIHYFYNKPMPNTIRARDRLHFGAPSHEQFYQFFLEQIKSLF